MKKRPLLLLPLLGLFSFFGAFAQSFQQSNGLMPIGAYYYPEHWPEDQWERDLKKMAELGFEFTHFGEFAWAKMEPEEGQYDFEWLDRCVGLAAKYGLKVIMCTPTPTPPAWLTQKHPEILSVDATGIQQQHGSRLHVSYNHKTYLHYVEKIVTELGKRYGKDDRIWGWQLDNEPHYGKLYEYNPAHGQEFQRWLRDKYGNIEALNEAWGAAFWSQTYNHFDQVKIPNANQAPQGINPHHLLDFQRFNAAELAAALRFQAGTLRKYIQEGQWITTNYAYFKFLPSVDIFLNEKDFDFAAHTMYLTSKFLSDHGSEKAFRLGSGMELAFSSEMAASVNGYTGIMELQPGQINWGVINPQPLPGAVRMWVWHSFALGDQFVCTYRFRQPRFGSEQTHYGIMMTDGVTVNRGGEEYVQAIEEIKALEKRRKPVVEVPKALASRNTAFLWDQYNLLNLQNHPHHADWDTWNFMYTYYQSLKSMGAKVTFLEADDEFDPELYPFMVVPAYQMASEALIGKWRRYAEKGGHLILTCRTASLNPMGHLWEAKRQEPLWDLIGAEVDYFDHLPAEYPGNAAAAGGQYPWHIWGDILEPQEGTNVLAIYQDQFYEGAAGAVTRKLGKGSVSYIGIHSDSGMLEQALVRKIYQDSGAEIMDLPRYVFAEWRDGFWVMVNYTSSPVEVPLPNGAQLLVGNETLQPGGVAVWVE